MALSKNDETILQEIVDLEGDCLMRKRCEQCPFRSMCLPEFLNVAAPPPTKQQRRDMALKVLTHNSLLEDTTDDVVKEYTWPTKEK